MSEVEHRRLSRRKEDRAGKGIHMDISTCPMTPERVEQMLHNQQELLTRLEKMERTLFAGRVALSTAAVIAVGALSTFEWFRTNIASIRDFFASR